MNLQVQAKYVEYVEMHISLFSPLICLLGFFGTRNFFLCAGFQVSVFGYYDRYGFLWYNGAIWRTFLCKML